jgi:hypothetical protein
MRDPLDLILLKLEMAERVLEFSYEHPDDDLTWIRSVEQLQALVERAEELLREEVDDEPLIH